jgi:hypothetical protein
VSELEDLVNTPERASVELICPCCHARLTVDAALQRVVAHQPPRLRQQRSRDLARADQLLKREAAQRETHFRQSAKEERIKSQLLERKFEEALRKTKDQPVTRPTREIDLD